MSFSYGPSPVPKRQTDCKLVLDHCAVSIPAVPVTVGPTDPVAVSYLPETAAPISYGRGALYTVA